MGMWEPIKPDFSKPWVRGFEHIIQEGTSYWRELREARGWSQEDVWELTNGELTPPRQMEIEGEYGIGFIWEIEDLVSYANLYGRKPGELLDECYEQMGQKLIDEEKDVKELSEGK